ncbi:hypothetical protein O9X98_05690 [Agrobacterium salinitolerans]|nr:hypothetical protein [Agrobacterium salinitolerans]
MEARYPALVPYACPPRHRYARPVVIAPRTEVEIPLLTRNDMPEVLRITHSNGGERPDTETYRSYAGQLYKKNSRYSLGELLLSLDDPLRFEGVFTPLMADIAEHLKTVSRTFKPWPDGILGHLQGRRRAPEAATRAIEQTHLVAPHRNEEFDVHLDFWREKFLKQVALYVVMDGDLWVTCPEPVIHVTLGSSVRMGINERVLGDDFLWDLSNYFFTISDRDAAQEYARQLPGSRGSLSIDEHMEVEIIAGDLLSKDIPIHEIRRTGNNLLRALNRFMGSVRQGDSLDVARDKIVEQLRRQPFDADGLASAIEEALELCQTPHREHRAIPFSHYETSIYKRHLERWDNRPIEVLNGGRAPSLPSSP